MQPRPFIEQKNEQPCEKGYTTDSSMKGNHHNSLSVLLFTVGCKLKFQGKHRTIELTWGETATTQVKGKKTTR